MKLFKTGLGQDSHRFTKEDSSKPCILAGIVFDDVPGLEANSDGDVIYHAICNAISSISGVLILGGIADDLLHKDGITDSSIFLKKALETLKNANIIHLAISIEAQRPKLMDRREVMKSNIAKILKIQKHQVGITATSGEGLTPFGCGEGIQCFCVITVEMDQ